MTDPENRLTLGCPEPGCHHGPATSVRDVNWPPPPKRLNALATDKRWIEVLAFGTTA